LAELQDFLGALEEFARRAGRPGPLYKRLGVIARSYIVKGIDAQTDVDGRAFMPLKFPRVRGGSKVLIDTGRMRAALNAGQGTVLNVLPDGFEVGLRGDAFPGAALLNFGGIVRPVKGKYLAIPLTADARAAGSPLNFPRPLEPRIGPRGGVMIDPVSLEAEYALAKEAVVPAREFVGISPLCLEELQAEAEDWLYEPFRKAGVI
jgi:hypothetical protein